MAPQAVGALGLLNDLTTARAHGPMREGVEVDTALIADPDVALKWVRAASGTGGFRMARSARQLREQPRLAEANPAPQTHKGGHEAKPDIRKQYGQANKTHATDHTGYARHQQAPGHDVTSCASPRTV